jgi:hypothetical protein
LVAAALIAMYSGYLTDRFLHKKNDVNNTKNHKISPSVKDSL